MDFPTACNFLTRNLRGCWVTKSSFWLVIYYVKWLNDEFGILIGWNQALRFGLQQELAPNDDTPPWHLLSVSKISHDWPIRISQSKTRNQSLTLAIPTKSRITCIDCNNHSNTCNRSHVFCLVPGFLFWIFELFSLVEISTNENLRNQSWTSCMLIWTQ